MLYLDSCVLIKHYIEEQGTDAVHARIEEESRQQQSVFISDVGYAEILAAFARKLRDNQLQEIERDEIQERFHDDWLFTFSNVELTIGVLTLIPDLVRKYPLKGFDAIHLASAIWLKDAMRLGKSFGPRRGILEFATSDKQLKTAASLEGLEVFDPENPR